MTARFFSIPSRHTEHLLIRDGPLAHVWLAANLEKKLTKHQLLQTSIEESTRAIVQSQNSQQEEPMALRITGQLLFGVVRIYSRKAKYLLDDVSDALMRIKTAFRSNQSVVLPVEATTVQNMTNLTLQDTITATDLLYQEPLNFDEPSNINNTEGGFFSTNFPDTSIEYPRAHDDYNASEMPDYDNNELDLELNFDLGEEDDVLNDGVMRGGDESIEVGRSAGVNASFDENNPPELEGSEFNLPELSFENDYDQPMTPPEESVPAQRKTRAPMTFIRDDVVRTTKRKIIVDDIIEIPSEVIREAQNELPGPVEQSRVLSTQRKLEEVLQAAKPAAHLAEDLQSLFNEPKRRKIDSPAPAEEQFDLPDFSLPELDFAHDEEQFTETEPVAEEEEDAADDFPVLETTEPTDFKTAARIVDLTRGSETTTFTSVIAKDQSSSEPLAAEPRVQASRAFFEMLVLATNNAIEVKQQDLFGEISIAPREGLATFV